MKREEVCSIWWRLPEKTVTGWAHTVGNTKDDKGRSRGRGRKTKRVSEHTERASMIQEMLAKTDWIGHRKIEISHFNLVRYYALGMCAGMKTVIHHSGNAVK